MGITLQRVIDQNKAARDYASALNELIRRIHVQLSQDPHNVHLQSLAALTPNDLLEHPTKSSPQSRARPRTSALPTATTSVAAPKPPLHH
jgi:hypothetical protein